MSSLTLLLSLISNGSSCSDSPSISNLLTNSSTSPLFNFSFIVSSLLFLSVPSNLITDSLASPLNIESSFDTVCNTPLVSLRSKNNTPP